MAFERYTLSIVFHRF